ncbi:tyrosine--tRNA ligase 1, cytoplasmic-like isoform X1 [Triticum urartu]|uniref:tyrosine--tRNA ligase 1, cytoplasmic-like isoform X1 n=1 Tax=Triticum urartu TaxID=4572 RepID=UPI00204414C5|nr:tyrosine--tRNA ligase 1, cytoplasmic-like isoform X1 [Triticum urartu]
MPPNSRPRLRLGFATRMARQQRMLETNSTEQTSETPTMDSWADVAASIDRDSMESSCYERIAALRSIGDQCVYADEFRLLLQKKNAPICYVWFEPTPWMDITQGLLKTIYVNKMVKAGYIVKILIADWFAQRNHRICSNKYVIRKIGCYNIEMWKAAGMDLDRVELVWFSDVLERHASDYWPLALDVSRKCTLKRMASCCTETAPYDARLPAAVIFYPCMQVAAILCPKLQADIWLFSMDQQEIVMLTREYCEDIKSESKPTIMLHNTLPNLVDNPYIVLKDPYNMREPKWNIFMHDKECALNGKISRAVCPPKVAVCNPCLEYIKYVIFPWFGKFEVAQKEQSGVNKSFECMEDLIVDYESGHLDPLNVKLAFEKGICKILEHVGTCLNSNAEAQALIIDLMGHIRRIESVDIHEFHW